MLIIDAQEQPITTVFNNTQQLSGDTGSMVLGRAVTAILHVSPNGDDTDGSSVEKAYTEIQTALDAASTDANECTLIMIGINTGANFYDINTTGDPTWTGNYVLAGSYRTWAKIKNTHAGATSIMSFTGYISLRCLNFNLGTGSGNGVIITKGAFRLECIQFVGQELTGAATALHIDGATTLKHGKMKKVNMLGHVTHMKGLLLDNVARSNLNDVLIHECATGMQIVHADSDSNIFSYIGVGDCALGLDIDAGNTQHFHHLDLHDNTRNIDDEVGDHLYTDIHGRFPLILLPDNFVGITLATDAVADTWGADTEILSAASRDNPFRIVGISVEADANEKFRIRLSADSGSSWFADVQVEGTLAAAQRRVLPFPTGTEEIFNKGIRISGSAKSESGGNNAVVWLQIQEI